VVDQAETLAIERAKALFGCTYANVQPHSGSQTNQAVFLATLNPGDTILGLRLDQGGHLTHGSPVNISGKWFNAHFYGVDKESERIDYAALEEQAHALKPKLISAGASAYPRLIDFERIGAIAKSVGALFLVDMAHIAGLVATGAHPHPFPWADVVTTTTHKTLRGPRGGMILSNNEELGKKINSAIFPGLQGGPLMHAVAAKAVALGEAQRPEYAGYIANVVKNSAALASAVQLGGGRLVSGGTDNHLSLVDVRPFGLTGKQAEHALDAAGLTCNKNMVPYDPETPFKTSGIRLGAAAGTTRGFGENEFNRIGTWIGEILTAASKGESNLEQAQKAVLPQVRALCAQFPIY
jgi:glycine hydroxymethyltransferase